MKPSHESSESRRDVQRPLWMQPTAVALVMIALIIGFYFLREHWNHLAGAWIYLLLLACPLMHLFHGHGGQGGHGSRESLHIEEKKGPQ